MKKPAKLALATETLRPLTAPELAAVVGGLHSSNRPTGGTRAELLSSGRPTGGTR